MAASADPRARRTKVAAIGSGLVVAAAMGITGVAARPQPGPEVPVPANEIGTVSAQVTAPPAAEVAIPQDRVSPKWVGQMATRAGIPAPAVRAYASATLRTNAEMPTCRLTWVTLAGIGWVESQHGTFGGRALDDSGHSTSPITGPALDGTNGNASLPPVGTEHITGDGQHEHAIGPMQFIGSTWASYAADGDGDGVADPLDIDDAALAAGRYLCTAGGALTTGANWARAVFAYNHSNPYVQSVHTAAQYYAKAATPTRRTPTRRTPTP